VADDDQEKTEQPTAFRLEEARERGQVPRSADLTGTLVMIVFSMTMASSIYAIGAAFAHATRNTLLLSGSGPAPSASLVHWVAEAFQPAWQSLLPCVLAMLVVAVAANLVQTGPTFSMTPLSPDFSRLNPAQGFKKIASMRTLWELFKLCLKLGLVGAFVWSVAGSASLRVQSAAFASPSSLGLLFRTAYVQVTTWILALLAFVALLDWIYSRREYIQKLRMSRRDMKDEVKRHQGDPDIRSKRKRLISDMLKRSKALRRVPDADIVLTNPTHVAIAVQYRRRTMRSPIVLSKGSDRMAARIREIAASSGVPCLRSPELARALFRECAIDQVVPGHLHAQLVPVYRWLMSRPGNKVFS
jgi:flagellar biosynthetic protein FlhB